MPRYGRRRGRSTTTNAGTPRRGTIVLSSSSVTLQQVAGSTTVVQAVIGVSNSGAGTFNGVQAGAITYGSGSGWLSVTVQPGFPAIITAVGDASGLAAGTYSATVPITDVNATNSPQTLTVSFVVAAVAMPSLVLSNPTMTLSVQQGNAATATATCLVTSGTAAGLGALSVGTVTGSGATGVSATIEGNVVTVTGASAALTNASSPYTAVVPIIDATASNSPQNITVTLNVAAVSPPATPTMALSASAVALSAVVGSGAVATTTVTVSSANGATLGTTSVGTVTGTGASAISTSVSGHVVTINAAVGSLAAAVYTLTVPILDSAASNSPQNVTVTFTVTAQPVGTTIPGAIELLDDTAGANVLVSAPWPLRPGDLTDADVAARKFRLYVGGVEQSIYVEALRGRHNDGSVRAVQVQFRYSIPNTTPIAASVVLGSVRGTTDLTRTIVDQDVIWSFATSPYGLKAKLVPTDASYLCQTLVSGMPLIPAAQDDADSYKLYGAYADNRFEAIKTLETTDQSAQSDYEMIRGLVGMWCRTADMKYYRQALSRLRYHLLYSVPDSGWSPSLNLDGITVPAGQSLISAEAKRMRQWNWFVGYYLTGWRQFHAMPGAGAQQAMYAGSLANVGYSRFGTNAIYWAPRNNLSAMPYMWIAALMDSTRVVNGSGGGGFSTSDLTTKLTAAWTHALANRYVENAGGTGWRTGAMFVDHRHTASGSGATGNWPFFQSALAGRQMIDYYLMVYADSRLPPVIKEETDRFVLCAKSVSGTAYAQGSNATTFTHNSVTYAMEQPRWGVSYATQPDEASGSAYTWLTPMWAPMFAFCAKYYGGNAPDGTAYATWYRRVVNVATVYHTGGSGALGWSWKIWGEIIGANLLSSWIMAQPGAPQGPATMRTPTVYTDWAPQ